MSQCILCLCHLANRVTFSMSAMLSPLNTLKLVCLLDTCFTGLIAVIYLSHRLDIPRINCVLYGKDAVYHTASCEFWYHAVIFENSLQWRLFLFVSVVDLITYSCCVSIMCYIMPLYCENKLDVYMMLILCYWLPFLLRFLFIWVHCGVRGNEWNTSLSESI